MGDERRAHEAEETSADARIRALLARDPELASAVLDVDRSLIHLAMQRPLRERLRAGVGLSKLAARFTP
jgi:hypothetical protein